jgi:hypothetical protein
MYDFSGPGHPAVPRTTVVIPAIPSSRRAFMRRTLPRHVLDIQTALK